MFEKKIHRHNKQNFINIKLESLVSKDADVNRAVKVHQLEQCEESDKRVPQWA
jgi:hypothetical protein